MYWDDMSGKQLDAELVKKARMEEMKELKEHTQYLNKSQSVNVTSRLANHQ